VSYQGFRIGSVLVDPPIVLAPLAGTSCAPFRLLCRRAGAGLVVSEMISATGLRHGNRKTAALLENWPQEQPVAMQFFGSDPDELALAAQTGARVGAAIIDFNLGCPVPKVRKSGAGAALLVQPDKAVAAVRAMADATSVPVTAKLRAGYNEVDAAFFELAERLVEAGAQALTLHARTAAQGFRGEADWRLIRRLKEMVPVPVIGNGDVRSGASAVRMLEETGCDGVMIGRAALGNPFIFAEAVAALGGRARRAPTAKEKAAAALCHAQMLCLLMGEERAVREMRAQVAWYVRGWHSAAAIRREAQEARTLGELAEILLTGAGAAELTPGGPGAEGS